MLAWHTRSGFLVEKTYEILDMVVVYKWVGSEIPEMAEKYFVTAIMETAWTNHLH